MDQWLLYNMILTVVYIAQSDDCSIIRIPYQFSLYYNEIPVVAGLNKQSYNLRIDLLNEQSWLLFINIKDYKFNNTLIVNNNVEFINNDALYHGKTIIDSFEVLDGYQIPFQFSIVTQDQIPTSDHKGAIGQPFSFVNTDHSLIHKFKQDGFIDHLSFTITDINRLYLGGTPDEDKVDRYYSYCNVLGINSTWNCNITGVIMNNGTKEYHYFMTPNVVTFTTDRNKNYVPASFFRFLVSEFFKEGIEKTHFRLSTFRNKTEIFSIDNRQTHGLITFIIDGYSYAIDLDSFFDCYEFGCNFNLFENPNGDYWVIGHDFYGCYHTVFDYDKKQIQFYSTKGVNIYKEEKNEENVLSIFKVIIFLFYLNIILIIIGVFAVLLQRIKIK